MILSRDNFLKSMLFKQSNLLVAAGLATIIALAYLLFSSDFGLYADDAFLYSLIARHDGKVVQTAFDFSLEYAGPGRPLGQVALILLFWLGNALAGVHGLYLLGGILLWVQAMLAFVALRHFASTQIAFLAAAAYIIFPADVARFLPVHALDSQLAAVAFWVSLILFLANQFLFAAVLIVSTLLLYEGHWLLAWGFPLLLLAKVKSIKEALGASGRYFFYLVASSGSVILWRLYFAPGRAAQALEDSNPAATLVRVVYSVIYGVKASAGALVERPLDFFQNGDSIAWVVAFISLLTLLLVTLNTNQILSQVPRSNKDTNRPEGQWLTITSLAVFGFFAWLASYPLYAIHTQRYPPVAIAGRLSNIHSPAAIGFVFIFVSLLLMAMAVIAKGYRPWRKTAVFAVIALYVSSLVGFFVVNQTRYVQNWAYQVDFWKKLALVTPDAQSSTLIVIEGALEANQMYEQPVFDWTLPYLSTYLWPLSGKQAPFVLTDEMLRQFGIVVEGRLLIANYPTLASRFFNIDDVIRVRLIAGKLYRTSSDVSFSYSTRKTANAALGLSRETLPPLP